MCHQNSPSLLDLTGLHGDGVGGTGIGGLDGEFVVGHLGLVLEGGQRYRISKVQEALSAARGRLVRTMMRWVDGDGKTSTDETRRYYFLGVFGDKDQSDQSGE